MDSDAPIYQLFDKEIWEEFSFRERYPGWKELRRYFDFLNAKIQFTKDTVFNCTVTGAEFDELRQQWLVKCADGSSAYARWFIPAIGFAAKAYKPNLPRQENFKGAIYHTAVRCHFYSLLRCSNLSNTPLRNGLKKASTSKTNASPSSVPGLRAFKQSKNAPQPPSNSPSTSARPTSVAR